jgi:hypothetical protein
MTTQLSGGHRLRLTVSGAGIAAHKIPRQRRAFPEHRLIYTCTHRPELKRQILLLLVAGSVLFK